MYNKTILVGNLTRDIELKYTNAGKAIANTAIATSRKYKAQDGTQKEDVMFIDIAFFGRTAEIANQYLHRGSKVLIEGTLKLDQWQDQNGGKRSKHSVSVSDMKMLGSKEDGQSNQQPSSYTQQNGQQPQTQTYPTNPQGYQQQQRQPQQNSIPAIDINDDEIPFNGGTR